MMTHRLCISPVLFVVDTTTLGSRIVYLSLSLSLLRARCCGMRRSYLICLAGNTRVFFLGGEWWWMDGGEDGRIARAPVNH